MGTYSLIFLFLGILIIGLIYAKTDSDKISHHILFAIILLLFLVVFFAIHHHFEKSCSILIAGDLDQVITLIRSWGLAAPLMSILLMITQAIIAPIPAFLITAANGMVFGNVWGALISWIGALVGALTSFYIARLFGKKRLSRKLFAIRKRQTLFDTRVKKTGFMLSFLQEYCLLFPLMLLATWPD